ncbi:MAG: protease inhibitor I42 family protein [Dehalococcoidales bacterium]|nr:protease inhibitor I42 family protein [Dehalococcoidales bacterium]
MKEKAILLGLILIAAVALTACSANNRVTVEGPTVDNTTEQADTGVLTEVFIDESQYGQTIEVAAGCLVTITLESNATTGFKWELSEPVDEGMLALIKSEYVLNNETNQDKPVAGAGSTEVWTFETLTPGDATISMAYSRPWEGGEKGVKTFALTIRSLSGRAP